MKASSFKKVAILSAIAGILGAAMPAQAGYRVVVPPPPPPPTPGEIVSLG